MSLTFAEWQALVHEEQEPGVASCCHYHEGDDGQLHVAKEEVREAGGHDGHEYSPARHIHPHPAGLVLGRE